VYGGVYHSVWTELTFGHQIASRSSAGEPIIELFGRIRLLIIRIRRIVPRIPALRQVQELTWALEFSAEAQGDILR